MTSTTKGNLAKLASSLVLLCAIAFSTTAASAELSSQSPPSADQHQGGPSDPTELREFIAALINEQLETNHIAGALVAVVKGDQVLLAEGYGYADVAAQRPFDPDRTLFPIGSTGKLFTWTAVMQLVEQGRLDLDADVNTYLEGLRIPDTYSEPVTLKHLMSHTAGFEERNMGSMAATPDEILSLKEYLVRYMPNRVRPPGELTAYSNSGAALAGYIVERVSGLPFEQYIEDNIFMPLGMTHSSFRQPLPAEMAEDLAAGYLYDEGFVPQPLMYVSMRPAGSMSTTASDIAHFMIAHLQNGRYEDVRILQEETARQMHSQLFANEPRLSGFAYGFMHQQINGQRVLHHGGGLPPYYGMLALLPETQVGFYVGYNGLGDPPAITDFRDRFFDHYYPQPEASGSATSGGFTSPEKLTGIYRTTRSNRTSLERILDLTGAGYGSVAANADGTLDVSINMGSSRLPGPFVEIEPLLFISTDGTEKIAFGKDSYGNVTRMFLDMRPECAFEKIPWYEAPRLHAAALVACMAIFALTILAGLARLLFKRRSAASKPNLQADRARRAALALSAVSMLTVASLIGLLAVGGLTFQPPRWIPGVLALAWLSALLSVIVLIFAVRAWIEGYWRLPGRLYYTLMAVAGMAFSVWMSQWNLLKFGW